jgi:hypothetical protein
MEVCNHNTLRSNCCSLSKVIVSRYSRSTTQKKLSCRPLEGKPTSPFLVHDLKGTESRDSPRPLDTIFLKLDLLKTVVDFWSLRIEILYRNMCAFNVIEGSYHRGCFVHGGAGDTTPHPLSC